MSEIMFSHQKRVNKSLFFYPNPPNRDLVLPNNNQLSNLQNGHREMLFITPHFWPFKYHWTCQKSCFLIRRGLKKPFFLSNLPQGGLVLPNKSQLSNLQNGHTEMIFITPQFLAIKYTTGHVRNQVFCIRRGLKKPFYLPNSPPTGSCFAK